jgi:hypothetical protein
MKKNLLILAAAALAFAACSNDEMVASVDTSQSNAISFRPLTTNITRTNGPGVKSTWETGDLFNVYASFKGIKYFQDDFTKQDGTNFTSENKHYWPADISSTNKVVFTAVWGATQKTDNPGVIEDYAPASEAASQMDVLLALEEYSAKPSENSTAGAAKLNFRHTLSQIVVNAKNSNPNLKVTISGVRVGYVQMQGDFNYGSGVVTTTQETEANGNAGTITDGVTLISQSCWTNDAMSGEATDKANTYKYNQASALVLSGKVDASTAFTSGWTPWILLPQTQSAATGYVTPQSGTVIKNATASGYEEITASSIYQANPNLNGSYLALQMTIENYVDSEAKGTIVDKQWCYWPIAFTWNPGYKYTYTIDVAGGGYQPIDTDGDGNLDPVLEGATIVFAPTCTIDYWVVASGTPVTGGM